MKDKKNIERKERHGQKKEEKKEREPKGEKQKCRETKKD